MSINKWLDKEAVRRIHNAIFLSYKKEGIWVSSYEVDKPRAHYTEWINSERERQILYIKYHIYMELERKYWWSYLQGSKRDTDIVYPLGEGEDGMIWENSIKMYALP